MRTQILDALLDTVVEKATASPALAKPFIGEYLKILVAENFSEDEIRYFTRQAARILQTYVGVQADVPDTSEHLLQ